MIIADGTSVGLFHYLRQWIRTQFCVVPFYEDVIQEGILDNGFDNDGYL